MQPRQQIRQQVRHARRQLSAEQQERAAHAVMTRFMALPSVIASQHIALYLSFDGELDTAPLINACWQAGKSVYLPVVHPFSQGHLLFLHYTPTTPMQSNRYGIAEPKLDIRYLLPTHQLEVIATPLVAFDDCGQRLGMGGGYYDRTLALCAHPSATAVGLAHDCQHWGQLPTEQWDMPLPHVLTPSHHWHWSATNSRPLS
ncbi:MULTISPECIES: 5-formyltetrahydrofolate cyclo-ligase [unclassified Salinivibrio]|uniref:5-formyltetrahydrofolate cyclo-ligase n=1 Tax=unclassified Salinivibrio TaxID=2636825 RepID=UPI000985E717|nr:MULTISPECIES: 5-formyltetrahydrofolate cyclo-ligase [unclassified Salinivibrio]OOF13719.1 5-formyltetrahydrofolate cyclo-ligase [Salinivibrio sp. PR919]OOF19187.1 5-formyltetrahydrofolate cyclo-ligase [Salinivibrio sp. PR932]